MDFLDQLRELNTDRVPSFGHGLDDWSVLEWAGCVCGEAGEMADVAKKIRRIDDGCTVNTLSMSRGDLVQLLQDEIADVIIYLDLLAAREGIDLKSAITRKFDEVSVRVGYPNMLGMTLSTEE